MTWAMGRPPARPLVGRDREQAAFAGQLDASQPIPIIVSGAEGLGKSHLLAAFATEARRRGRNVIDVHGASCSDEVTLAPLLSIVPPGAPLSAPPTTLFRLVLQELTRARNVIVVDDAHLLDDSTAAAVSLAAGAPDVICVLALRSADDGPAAIDAVRRAERCVQLDLDPLDQAEVTELLTDDLGATIPADTRFRFWRQSRGVPMLLVGLLDNAKAQDRLHRGADGWVLSGPLTTASPVIDRVTRAITKLSDSQIDLLEVISMHGGVDVALLRDLPTGDSLSELERRGHLVIETDDSRRTAHLANPLLTDVLANLPERSTTAEAMSRLSESISEAAGSHRSDFVLATRNRIAAGDDVGLNDLLTAAGRALELADYTGVEELARHAAKQSEAKAAHILIGALAGQHRITETEDTIARASAVALEPDEEAMIHWAAAAFCVHQLTDLERAERHIGLGLDIVESTATRDALRVERMRIEWALGRSRTLLRRFDRGEARSLEDPAARVTAALIEASACQLTGQFTRSGRAVDRLRQHLDSDRQASWMAQERADFVETINHVFGLEPQRAVDEGRSAVEAARPRGIDNLTIALVALLECQLIAGRLDPATKTLDELEASAELGSNRLPDNAGATLGAVAATSVGDWPRAEQLVSRIDMAGPNPCRPLIAVAQARLAAERRDLGEARRLTIDGVRVAWERGQLIFGAMVADELVRLGFVEEGASWLSKIVESTDDRWIGRWWAQRAAMQLADDADGLDALAAEFAAAGFELEALRTQVAAAGATNDPSDELSRLLRAKRDFESPGSFHLVPQPKLPLTNRELELTMMASTGLTNRELADQVFLSQRTVENHLHRAYRKLRRPRAEVLELVRPFAEGFKA